MMVSQSNRGVTAESLENGAGFSVFELLHTLIKHWRLLVLVPLVIGVAGLGLAFLIPPTYTARTTFIPPQQQQGSANAMLQSLGSLGGLAGAASGLKNPADQYVALLRSRTVQVALAQRFKLRERYRADAMEDAVSTLDAFVSTTAGKDGLIQLQVSDRDPVFAAQLANAHIEELKRLVARLALTEAQQRRQFFEKQLLQVKQDLVVAELALKRTGVDVSTLKSSPASAVSAVAQLQAQITAQQLRLAGLRRYATESSPEVKEVVGSLAALQRQLDQSSRVVEGVKTGDDYIARYRDVKYQETLFEMLAKQYEFAKVDEARDGPMVQVVDEAVPPEYKSKPMKGNIAITTTMAAFFLTLSFVLVREVFRRWSLDPEASLKLSRLQRAWR
jgi:tyrosine-protein kinase Etk/Wzc